MRYVRNSDREMSDDFLAEADEKELLLRKPNELEISAELLEDFFKAGYERPPYRVRQGPSMSARIIGVRFNAASNLLVLEYDRVVDECLLIQDAPTAVAS